MMSSNVVHLEPRLRLVLSDRQQTDRELRAMREREAAAATRYLRIAADAIEAAATRGIDASYIDAIPDAKAGLFHLLTLAGCREVDRPVREALRER